MGHWKKKMHEILRIWWPSRLVVSGQDTFFKNLIEHCVFCKISDWMDTACFIQKCFVAKVFLVWRYLVNSKDHVIRINMDRNQLRKVSKRFSTYRKIPVPVTKVQNYNPSCMYRYDRRLGFINIQVTLLAYTPGGYSAPKSMGRWSKGWKVEGISI